VAAVAAGRLSGEATAELRKRGIDARSLVGGITAWHAMSGPTVPLARD
jgi:Fe-Mn family superoxide dismutase